MSEEQRKTETEENERKPVEEMWADSVPKTREEWDALCETIVNDIKRQELLKQNALASLQAAVERAREFFEVECYVNERSVREMGVQLALYFTALAILGLLVAVDVWYWRLALAAGYLLLGWTWSRGASLRGQRLNS